MNYGSANLSQAILREDAQGSEVAAAKPRNRSPNHAQCQRGSECPVWRRDDAPPAPAIDSATKADNISRQYADEPQLYMPMREAISFAASRQQLTPTR